MTTQWLSFLSVFPALGTQNVGATAQEDKRNEGFLIATKKAEDTWGRHLSLPGLLGQVG